MQEISDNTIIGAQSGSDRDKAALADWLYSNVGNFLNKKYYASTTQDERDDVIQDTVIRTVENIKKYSFQSQFNTWAFTIGRNTMLNYLKKERERINVDVDPDNVGKDGFLDRLQTYDLSTYVNNAIQEVPKHYSSVMLMRDFDGLSYNEISELTGLNIGTVKSRIYRARESIQRYFLVNNIAVN